MPGHELAIQVDLASRAPDTWEGTISIPSQNVKGFPLSALTVKDSAVGFAMKGVPGDPQFQGTLSKDGRAMSGGVGAPAAPVGMFEGHGDIGAVQRAGAATYDAATRTYTVAGSGENIWGTADALHFVWMPMSGDLTLAADVALEGAGTQEHRKAVLMVRQSLDADAAYVDVALHGNGLTSLQFRDHRGDATHEVQANVSAPARLQIEKRGTYVTMSLGATGARPRFSGAARCAPVRSRTR